MEPIFIQNFLPNQIINIAYNYCLLKYDNKFSFEIDSQSNSLISEYGDFFFETLLDLSTPVIEQNVGKKLFPTYSFLRIYDLDSDLPIHTDRPSCEYTVALAIGADPVNKPYDIFLGTKDPYSDYKYIDGKKNYTGLKIEQKFSMNVNDALIFQGMDKLHWREKCYHDHFITVFLHYVDQDGDYKNFKYDQREILGAFKKNKI